MKKILHQIFLIIFLSLFTFSSVFSEKAPVKKSRSNICHAPGTTYYKKTKYYKSYKTLKDCLKSGGRLPRK